MPSSLENVKIGVCLITYNATDLGYTKGGVEVEVTTETFTVTVDQFGDTPISDYISGRTCKVTTPLAETTLDNLVATMPGATLVTDGTDSTKKHVNVTSGTGINLIDQAKELILHPKGVVGTAYDFTIPKAATPGNLTFAYRHNEERVFNCTWHAYPDTENNDRLFIYGDKTAIAA